MNVFDKWLNKYADKKIQELEKHPEKNKKGKLSQKQIKIIVKIVMILIFVALLVYICHFRVSYTQRIIGYD